MESFNEEHNSGHAMTALYENLKKYWGYDDFRPLQREAMDCVMAGRDSVVVLPTGGGKSLCYQVPATATDGLALVVSPLISLMKDQVDALRANGVAAECVNSAMSEADRRRVWQALQAGELKLLYVTPERLAQPRFLGFLREINVSFVAIDEAHCISEWGHDFRPEYRELKALRETLPNISLHGLTATATPRVRRDIATSLGLRDPKVIVGSFDRPNLQYRVRRRDNLLDQVLAILKDHEGESGIIYCIRRKDVDALCDDLNTHGHRALPYHAGLADHERVRNQDAFIKEEADIVVATVAFGMGIDKPNVRYVIHAAMPKSIENYQQESGRAGRDGLPAGCYLLYGDADIRTWRFITRDMDEQAAAIAESKLRDMANFCSGMTCRHKALAGYFGEQLPAKNCKACDVCLGTVNTFKDSDGVARTILSGVAELAERFGANYTADVLSGSQSDKVVQRGHFRTGCFGALKEYRKRNVRDWIEQLVGQEFLAKTGDYNILEITPDGKAFLNGADGIHPQLHAPITPRSAKRRSTAPSEGWTGVDRDLFEVLRALRKDLATERHVPPYVVFGDVSLRDMARKKPTTHSAFRDIHGVGEAKERDFAEPFIAAIQRYLGEHGEDPAPSAPKRQATKTGDIARQMFKEGASVEDVRRATGRVENTVVRYLTDYIAEAGLTDPYPWLDSATYKRIREAVGDIVPTRMRDLYERFNGEIEYDALQIAVACIRNEQLKGNK